MNPDNYMAQLDTDTCLALQEADICTRAGSVKKRLYPYQAAWLYKLARGYNQTGAQFLEIGTYYGYTAALLSLAAPKAAITTLNPTSWEVEVARENLRKFKNVHALWRYSWELLETYGGPELDFIFIDGDHKHVKRDLPWWNWVAHNGLMVFHDYSPADSPRPCEVVYNALNEFSEFLGRGPDESLIAPDKVGMVAWRKQAGDRKV